ncbi:MAG: pro-sigmaK processing inhibitor BofA family protein [Clostridia bacterium]|nr:pro-sigmaK processing inhibitor BofA family protein [Clostridia bacterium]
MGEIILFIVAIAVIALVLKLLGKSMKVIGGVLINALVGGLIIWLLNIFGLGIAFNWLNALLVGCLGIPGVIIVLILKFVFHV